MFAHDVPYLLRYLFGHWNAMSFGIEFGYILDAFMISMFFVDFVFCASLDDTFMGLKQKRTNTTDADNQFPVLFCSLGWLIDSDGSFWLIDSDRLNCFWSINSKWLILMAWLWLVASHWLILMDWLVFDRCWLIPMGSMIIRLILIVDSACLFVIVWFG